MPRDAVLVLQLTHLRLRPLQPVRHTHLAIHVRRDGEMLPGLLALARAPVELVETEIMLVPQAGIASSYTRRMSGALSRLVRSPGL